MNPDNRLIKIAALSPMRFYEIRKSYLQNVVDTCCKNYPTLRKVKILFNNTYKFALENDIVSKDYCQYIDIIQCKNRIQTNAIDSLT